MQIILVLFILGVVLYILQTLFIFIGTHRLNYPQITHLPKISILVALKDEEQTLEACVESLLQLDYPKESFEILLINDRSSDRTPELIEELEKKENLKPTERKQHTKLCADVILLSQEESGYDLQLKELSTALRKWF